MMFRCVNVREFLSKPVVRPDRGIVVRGRLGGGSGGGAKVWVRLGCHFDVRGRADFLMPKESRGDVPSFINPTASCTRRMGDLWSPIAFGGHKAVALQVGATRPCLAAVLQHMSGLEV